MHIHCKAVGPYNNNHSMGKILLYTHIHFRSWFAMAALGVSMSSMIGCQTTGAQDGAETVQLVAGTYNTKGSEGIYGLTFNTRKGTFSKPELLSKADNPSWITIADKRLYVANEIGDGRLTTYAVNDDDSLKLEALGSVLTHGASPCYVALSPDQQYLATANYMGGNVSLFTLDERGVATGDPQILQNYGKGPNTARQEAPHAHWVQWDQEQTFLYSVDLGIDEVKVYPFDEAAGKAGKGLTALKLQPGDGPRHMFFHPQKHMAYILNELSNTITVVEQNRDGTLTPVQRVPTLPSDFHEHSQAAHLYVTADGKHLYASNRGHDSIAVYAIADSGHLTLLETEAVQGDWPRHFLVLEDADTLLVANQESHNVVAFKIAQDGTLNPTGEQVAVPQVTFLGRLK